jgi:uncharacterized membrane protein HdeD (DUF308 family)
MKHIGYLGLGIAVVIGCALIIAGTLYLINLCVANHYLILFIAIPMILIGCYKLGKHISNL